MRLLILNSQADPRPYFKTKGLDFDIDFKTLDVTPPLVELGKFSGGIMKSPDVVEYVRGIIEPNEYNFVLWCYPASKYPDNLTTGGKSFAYPHVYLGTHLATVRLDGAEEHYMVHELLHLFFYHLSKLGYPVKDEMDTTRVDGKLIEYYKDNQRDDPDSNHSRTWASIAPYKSILSELAPVLKKGMKSPWVKQLQLRLNELGYWTLPNTGYFGTQTEKAIKSWQKKKGLVEDGIVGKKTLSSFETKKKP